ncbi:Rai1 [Kluyveromyces lactis]|nr:Rai1 [Kluyveromyces lactis]
MVLSSSLFVQKRSTTTALKQPKELGHYSRTQDNEFLVNDDSRLAYYYLPDTDLDKKLDLLSGIKKFKECNTEEFDSTTLHGLLSTLEEYERRKSKKTKVDIITFRGIIRKLISSAFDSPQFNPVNFRIVSFDGQLFIKEVKTDASETSINKNRESLQARAYYSGYKFEALATLSLPLPLVPRTTLEKRPKKIINNGDQFISMVRTGIGKCKILIGAEVDCIFDFKEDSDDNLKHYAELKCTTMVNTVADAHKFERKLFRTWLQCFLVGINRIIYGFRDDNFMLKTVEEFTTSEVPLILKNNNPQMQTVCVDAIKWYGAFTEWLLTSIPRSEDDIDTIKAYKLIFENNHLKLTEIESDDEEYEQLVEGEEILSNSFKQWRKDLHK